MRSFMLTVGCFVAVSAVIHMLDQPVQRALVQELEEAVVAGTEAVQGGEVMTSAPLQASHAILAGEEVAATSLLP